MPLGMQKAEFESCHGEGILGEDDDVGSYAVHRQGETAVESNSMHFAIPFAATGKTERSPRGKVGLATQLIAMHESSPSTKKDSTRSLAPVASTQDHPSFPAGNENPVIDERVDGVDDGAPTRWNGRVEKAVEWQRIPHSASYIPLDPQGDRERMRVHIHTHCRRPKLVAIRGGSKPPSQRRHIVRESPYDSPPEHQLRRRASGERSGCFSFVVFGAQPHDGIGRRPSRWRLWDGGEDVGGRGGSGRGRYLTAGICADVVEAGYGDEVSARMAGDDDENSAKTVTTATRTLCVSWEGWHGIRQDHYISPVGDGAGVWDAEGSRHSFRRHSFRRPTT
ncbi:hypothetical protein C8F01DRAFT_1084311 [Mycena amicta]|nr:hypothetical protein C8F01DRAFT_1084311 [Mycena amicta]